MLSMVTWLWKAKPGYRSVFTTAHVNTLRAMVARHYDGPHRFLCVTDMTKGLDARVEVVPPWNDYADVPSPSGGRNPSCYRRLRAFHPDIAQTFGPRFVSFDLDVVVVGALRPLFDRPEDFVIWGDVNPKTFYNGSLFLMTAGARPQVWTSFHPMKSPALSRASGHFGSDQGWISHCLGPHEAKWSTSDGVYSFQKHILPQNGKLPANAAVVVFHGHVDPWMPMAQRLPWVKEHWTC
jgi:hypothetical protein